MRRKKGYFSISAVAKMFSIHQQTIRLYEREGLISPKRSEGNTRLFEEEDIRRLEEIFHLTHKMGINLAGVEMILKLQKQIQRLQKEMNGLFDNVQRNLNQQNIDTQKNIQHATYTLLNMKRSLPVNVPPKALTTTEKKRSKSRNKHEQKKNSD